MLRVARLVSVWVLCVGVWGVLLGSFGPGIGARAYSFSETVSTQGDGDFDFEVLGSLCFDRGSSQTAVTTVTKGTTTQKLLIFTQLQLHNLYTGDMSCADQVNVAECVVVDGKQPCQTQLTLGTHYNITYSSSDTSELFFVVWGCDNTRTDLDYSIVSSDARTCSNMRSNWHATGYTVAIVLLLIINLLLAAMVIVFWKRKEQLASIEI